MKKLLLIIVIIMLLSPPVMGRVIYEHVQTNGTMISDGQVMTGSGYLYGFAVVTDGTNAVTVEVYDGTDNTGVQIVPSWIVTTSPTDRIQTVSFDSPLAVDTGIYVDITTSGTVSYNGYFRRK